MWNVDCFRVQIIFFSIFLSIPSYAYWMSIDQGSLQGYGYANNQADAYAQCQQQMNSQRDQAIQKCCQGDPTSHAPENTGRCAASYSGDEMARRFHSTTTHGNCVTGTSYSTPMYGGWYVSAYPETYTCEEFVDYSMYNTPLVIPPEEPDHTESEEYERCMEYLSHPGGGTGPPGPPPKCVGLLGAAPA